jgi:GxxExxY protein
MLHHEDTKNTKDTKAWALAASHEIIGAAIEVHRLLGPGLLESVYEVALYRELRLRGVAFERQVSVPVHYKGETLNCQVKLDLLVTGNVIVEVKSVEKVLPVLLRVLRVLPVFVVDCYLASLSTQGELAHLPRLRPWVS